MTSFITSRPYRDEHDYWRMRRFLQRSWQVSGVTSGLFHVGDLTWQHFTHPPEQYPPAERIALWERPDGELAGFAWYSPTATEVAIQIDPLVKGTAEYWRIAAEMLEWAEARRASNPASPDAGLSVDFESDAACAEFMLARGFAAESGDVFIRNVQALGESLPRPVLPEGYVVRAVRDDETEQRVALHQEVWHPSRLTLEGYRLLTSSPGYDRELDLVAVAPDGTFAAYTTAWHDEVNQSGLFEPVGARAAFRGQGLTKAVMHEGLRRLRERGCTTAYVCVEADNPAGVALYRSAGFTPEHSWMLYGRTKA